MPQIKNMMQMLRGNPQAAVNQLIQRNPQLANVIKENGGDPQKAFYALANRMGVDPDDVLGMLK